MIIWLVYSLSLSLSQASQEKNLKKEKRATPNRAIFEPNVIPMSAHKYELPNKFRYGIYIYANAEFRCSGVEY